MNLQTISDTELRIGIEKTLSNANELIEEGDILFEASRYSRAYCLFQLAAEEVGKSRLLFALIVDRQLGNKIDYKVVNKEFAHHQTKSKSALTFEMIAFLIMYSSQNDKPAEERKSKFLDSIERVQLENNVTILNNNKNDSLYIGVKAGKFVKPKDTITKEMTISLRANVVIRFEAAKTVLLDMIANLETIIELMKQANNLKSDEMPERFLNSFFHD